VDKEKLSPAQAEKKYVSLVNKFKDANNKGYDANRTVKADGTPISKEKLAKFAELSK